MSKRPSGPCTREVLAEFTKAAKPAARLTYFIADNAHGYRGLDWKLRWETSSHLRAIVNGVRSLYNAGFVDLVQERRSEDETHYVVIWRQCPVPPGQFVPLPMLHP